jgi:hypothetical protein
MFFSRFLEFEPSVSYIRDTKWFDDPQGNDDHQSRDAYQFEARLSTVLERIFYFERRDIKKSKHKVTPKLTYTFRAAKDGDEPRPWFEPMDTEEKINRVAFSLENRLDARKEDDKGGVTYWQWGTFTLSQGYDIEEERRDEPPGTETEPWEPLEGVLSLTPFPGLDLDAEAHWDHEEDEISFADLSLELSIDRSGGRKDRFMIDYQFIRGESETIIYHLDVNLLYGFSFGTSLQRDINLRHDISSAYWLEYQSQCWGVRLSAEEIDDVSTVLVTFRLLGFGGI